MTPAYNDIPVIIEPRQRIAESFHIDGNRGLTMPPELMPALQIGRDQSGAEIAQMFLGAEEILALCQRYTDYCSEDGSPIRRGRPQVNGSELLIEGEAYIDVLNRWQFFQLLLGFEAGAALQFKSITLEGALYAISEHGLGKFLRDMQANVNQALGTLTARMDGSSYELASLGVSDNQLVLTFRGG